MSTPYGWLNDLSKAERLIELTIQELTSCSNTLAEMDCSTMSGRLYECACDLRESLTLSRKAIKSHQDESLVGMQQIVGKTIEGLLKKLD